MIASSLKKKKVRFVCVLLRTELLEGEQVGGVLGVLELFVLRRLIKRNDITNEARKKRREWRGKRGRGEEVSACRVQAKRRRGRGNPEGMIVSRPPAKLTQSNGKEKGTTVGGRVLV